MLFVPRVRKAQRAALLGWLLDLGWLLGSVGANLVRERIYDTRSVQHSDSPRLGEACFALTRLILEPTPLLEHDADCQPNNPAHLGVAPLGQVAVAVSLATQHGLLQFLDRQHAVAASCLEEQVRKLRTTLRPQNL